MREKEPKKTTATTTTTTTKQTYFIRYNVLIASWILNLRAKKGNCE